MHIPINENIHISPLQWSDLNDIAHCCGHPSISNNTSNIPYPYAHSDAATFLKMWADKTEFDITNTAMAIRNNESKLIGSIEIKKDEHHKDHIREIGYWLGFDNRNKGIVSAAAQIYSDWILKIQLFSVLRGMFLATTPASKRVLEKAGFELEGYLRKLYKKNGKYIDTYLLAKAK